MSVDSEVLFFEFDQQKDSMLHNMNLLREQNLFCDVSIYINDTEFPGHKVVFAACSTFMRDQFLLSHSKEVQISILQNPEVGRQLLLSCYTGILKVKKKELLSYLTSASYLQMSHIVEKCTEALTKYLDTKPTANETVCSIEESGTEIRSSGDCSSKRTVQSFEPLIGSSSSTDFPLRHENAEMSLQSTFRRLKFGLPELKSAEIPEYIDDCQDSDICIVKVESISRASGSGEASQIIKACSNSPETRLYYSETQHSMINSTVDTRFSEMTRNHLQGYFNESVEVQPLQGNTSVVQDGGVSWRHQCPKCPRVFRQLENYLRHLKMHKLFLCLQCGKTFTQKKNLNRHMRGHMGIRPFQCTVCMKTFTAKSTLRDHMNIHSGDRPYKCHFCSTDFKHKSALKKHLTSVHGKNSYENIAQLVMSGASGDTC
ncbi:zinc finger and BTB domain-containing protein 6 [Protopterus annectens]|uniref:zinc finger and BTB domain-containing protein 6 n=1 Tax=Protopterus annectens TaxID=7888 RepID=UPI001CF9E3AD|nr:zinc finger and BTB domain-containing protein 6 [Protopterus annectens]